MRLRKISELYFLLLHLLIIGYTCAKTVEESEVTGEKKVTFDETSPGNQYSDREATTNTSLKPVANNNRKLIIAEALPGNDSDEVFRPSIHLGEIEQPTIRTNPFNNVQDVRFESNVYLDTQYERSRETLPDGYQDVSSLLDEATRSSRIKFQDAIQTSGIYHPLDDRQVITESPSSSLEEATVGHIFVDQMFFQNEKPELQDTIFGEAVADRQPTGVYFEASKSPYAINYYTSQNHNAYQPISQEATIEMIKKPESNGVLVVQQQESTYTRKRKFPYPFYQPGGEYHDVQYVEEPHSTLTYPRAGRLSPWKKIIRLIGTFLPLGLLLASLTPNVVRIANTTTQPIVLSKLRVADLPAEHKRARLLDDQSATCEDQSICELILAGSKPRSNMLQNILWNLVIRTPDDVAKRNDLREMFTAVKKKDCTTIGC